MVTFVKFLFGGKIPVKQILRLALTIGFVLVLASVSFSAGPINEEKVFNELKDSIPSTAFKTVDDLYSTWQDIQTGKSKATIIDIRREAEFDAGHIRNTNNLEAEMVYTIPKKISDPDTEIWVLCRTKHRATYFVSTLYKYGYKNVFIVDKGISGWADKGYPLFNKYMGEIKVTKYQHISPEQFAFREDK